MKKTIKMMVATALAVILVPVVNAATSQTPTATVTVPTILDLAIDTTTVAFGSVALADFTAGGKTLTGTTSLTVKTNRGWRVDVKGNTAAWAFVASAGDPDPSKVVGDLQVKNNGGTGVTVTAPFSAVTSLTASDVSFASGVATPNAGRAFTQDYKVLLNLASDVPGAYTLVMTYTAVNP